MTCSHDDAAAALETNKEAKPQGLLFAQMREHRPVMSRRRNDCCHEIR